MLHSAAERVRAAGYHVLGAHLSPSHDGYVQPKAASLGTPGLSAPLRLEIARRAAEDDPLVSVASWEASFPGAWPDFPVVCAALAQHLTQHSPPASAPPTVFYVCGTDHATKCSLWAGRRQYGVVVVPRDGDAVRRETAGVLVAKPAEGATAGFSSSRLREALTT